MPRKTVKRPSPWTMGALDRMAREEACGLMSFIDMRFALIALFGHPEEA